MMSLNTIGFIGAGNMAEALIKGVLAKGHPSSEIVVADPSLERQHLMRDTYKTTVVSDNRVVLERARLVVLAIKPQQATAVVGDLTDMLSPDHLLVTILAGTATATLERLLGGTPRIVRVMPNTPALVGAGASALCAGKFASAADLAVAADLFRCVGLTCSVNEEQMDAVTGLSGSGPAYVFSVIEALTDGGVAEGLSRDIAKTLAVETVLGAARLVKESGEDPAVLRQKVCSPGGTTIAGLTALEDGGLRTTLIDAVARASRRSRELGRSS